MACNRAGWREELRFHTEADILDAVAPELRYTSRWMNSKIPNLSNLTYLVQDFNRKVLTYPEDVLSAFSGIQSLLHRTYPGGLTFGHPEFFFDISLVWRNIGDLVRRRPSNSFTGNPSLDNLPSWSWMGWHGTTCFPRDVEFQIANSGDHGFLEPVTEWYTMSSPSSLSRRRIQSQWLECKKLAQDD